MFIIYGSDNQVVFAGEGLDAVPDGVQVFAGDKAACVQQVADAGLTVPLELMQALSQAPEDNEATRLALLIRASQAQLDAIKPSDRVAAVVAPFKSQAQQPNPPIKVQ
jgi:hypothetical protein